MLPFSGGRFGSRKSLRRGTPASAIESLEERTLLSAFTVSNLNDHGAGSLRQAILNANSNPGADVINFNVAGTITLASALPTITGHGQHRWHIRPGLRGNAPGRSQLQQLRRPAVHCLRGWLGPALAVTGRRLGQRRHARRASKTCKSSATTSASNTDGTTAAGNHGDGIELIDSSNNTIGGECGRRPQRHLRQRPAGHSRQPFVEQRHHEQLHRHRRDRHGCPRQRRQRHPGDRVSPRET